MRRGTPPLQLQILFRSVSQRSVASSSDFTSVVTCGACGFQSSIQNCCILTAALFLMWFAVFREFDCGNRRINQQTLAQRKVLLVLYCPFAYGRDVLRLR